MRTYIGIDPGTESMGFAFYYPETNTFEIIHLKRQELLDKYFDGTGTTLNLLNCFLNESMAIYYRMTQDEDEQLKAGWIERTFSIHSPIFSPLLVVLTTIIKEELKLKAVSVKHWRKVLTEKGNITKKDCVQLLKTTYPILEGKTNDEIESLGIAIACAVENGEPNPINPVSNRAIRKIDRKSKTKNGKKPKSTKLTNRDIPQQLTIERQSSSSTKDVSITSGDNS